ncbi:bifunctional glutamine synthetase adenylyltransferase/deadenyltransferase, partial [Klebsiella pneumoniae]|nr:bifunctional glutamine synthetase adenylyltransferase/deadenyltransferase [Klebsiella pneumoniae]
ESGDTDGRRERGNQEFFTKVGQKLIALLNDITADGQVFRVDMRLRPDGDSGALVLSETALEQYLITQGREWERYAWCKGRVVTPYPNGIKSLVRPFVFRKYLDYGAYEAMRKLHRQICSEV